VTAMVFTWLSLVGAHGSRAPVAASTSARRSRRVVPILENAPPTNTSVPSSDAVRARTSLSAFGFHASSAPVLLENAARWLRVTAVVLDPGGRTDVNLPPM